MKQEYYWFFHSMLCIFFLNCCYVENIGEIFMCRRYKYESVCGGALHNPSNIFSVFFSSFIMKKNRRYYIIFFLPSLFIFCVCCFPSYLFGSFLSEWKIFLSFFLVCLKVVCLRLHFIFSFVLQILLENYLQTYEEKWK